jgi:cytohesin
LVKNNFRDEDNLLLTALKKGNHEIIKKLSSYVSLDIVDSYKNNALAIAINLGNAKLAKFILDENLISNLNQVNINQETPYLLALKNSQDELAISLKDKIDPKELERTNYNFLANMASGLRQFNLENIELIKKILDQFPNDESSKIIKDKLMILASKNGNKKMVELLIKKGADVNAVDENGISAIQHSVMKKNIGTTHILLRNSVDINYSNPLNNSAILYAIASQNKDITELLLKSNPNLSMLSERIEVSSRSCFSLLKTPICKITINQNNLEQENQITISNPEMIKLVRRLMRQPSSQQPSSQSINSSASSLVITTQRISNLG